MGNTQARVGCGSGRGRGIPNNTMWVSLSLAECLGMQRGWGGSISGNKAPFLLILWNA